MSNRQLLPAHARALRFAEHLRSIPLSQWDFATCLTTEFVQEFINQKGKLPQHFCGSIGCAVGQLPLWAEGAADGWTINLPEPSKVHTPHWKPDGTPGWSYTLRTDPEKVYVFRQSSPYGAFEIQVDLADYFGLPEEQISYTFFATPSYGVDVAAILPKMVADRLCELVHACYEVEVGA